MSTNTLQTASLRANLPFSGDGFSVDKDAGVIRGAAVMVIGPARGHGFELDATSLQMLVDAINRNDGSVKVRAKHPEVTVDGQMKDDLFDVVGSLSNVRIDGDRVRGDITIEGYAKSMPGLGDVRTYLLERADADPESFGLSAVIGFDIEPVKQGEVLRLMARIHECDAVDLVGCGAATPDGLLSQKQPADTVSAASITTKPPASSGVAVQPPAARQGKASLMEYDPKMNDALKALGMPEGASEDDAKAFFNALTDDQKASCKAKLADATLSAKRSQIITDAGDELLAREGKRVTQLQMLGQTLKVPGEVVQLSIAAGDTVIDAQKKFLAHLQKTAKPVAVDGDAKITVGEDKRRTMLRSAIPDALRLRGGQSVKGAHEEAGRLASLSLIDMTRQYLAAHGVADAAYMSAMRVAEAITSPRYRASLAQSTSDFDNILLDAANKTLRQAYEEIPVTWTMWARRSTNPDFKAGNRIQLSEIGLPIERKEGGEYKYNTVGDGKEQVTLTEYVTALRLTRRAIINDDLDAFSRIPSQMGQAFRRLEDRLAYAVLTSNPTLATTGGALFNATALTSAAGHNNLISSGGAPTVTTLAATSALMRKQVGMKKVTGDQGYAYLNLQPKTVIVPVALEVVAAQLVGSSVDPSKSNQTPNPYFNRLQVVSHPVLDESSATKWYLAADPNTIDTVEVCFLQDEPAPVLKNETEFDTDDIKFAGRHTVTAKAIDYRGLACNNGA